MMRDRLIELLQEAEKKCQDTKQCENCIGFGMGNECVNYLFANYLLANGVIVPPCKIGQTVWLCTSPENIRGYDFDGDGEQKEIFECVVENITFYSSGTHQVRCYCNGKFVAHYLSFSDLGKTVFLTREEAEARLKGR